MARTRRQPSKAQAAPAKAEEFTCPECGRTFTRAAALGAHRRRAHGVIGSSAQARAKRTRTPATSTPANSARAATAAAGSANSSRSRPRARRTNATFEVDRDALLQTVFPTGVPAREAVIRAANDWLAEAERLAALK